MGLQPSKPDQPKIFMLIVAILAMVAILASIISSHQQPIEDIKFSDFRQDILNPPDENSRIVEAVFQDSTLYGLRSDGKKVRTFAPQSESITSFLEENRVTVNYLPPESDSLVKTLFVHILPIVIIVIFFVVIMRSLQVGGGKAMSFGKSRARLASENRPKVTFADIAGIDEAKDELSEIIDFLKDPKKFTKLGGRIPKGVLLVGSPGTGKTVLAKGVAGEAGVPFFSISGSDFVEMFVGVGASRVRDLFEQAKKQAPCIVFIDEIDAVGRQRGAGLGGGHDEREQTLNQLLVEMDGFEANEGVILIAATNRVDVLDPALLRPGRFDRRVYVPAPDIKGREGILKVHTKKTPLAEDVDLSIIAQATPGFTGADLENLINEAALIAARSDCKQIEMIHCEQAKDKVMMGSARKSLVISEEDRKKTAYHEAGHALVGMLTKGCDPIYKVTIIPRGHALGVTVSLPEKDHLSPSKTYYEAFILRAMGGRAAEELIFNEKTSGASNDIMQATDIARKMVCSWGMSDDLGPIAIGAKDGGEVFMGRGTSSSENHSEALAQRVDKEVHDLLTRSYDQALSILRENREKLVNLSEALLIKETLNLQEMNDIIAGKNVVSDQEMEAYRQRVRKATSWWKGRNKVNDDDSPFAAEGEEQPA